jgi:hypothetical protein
MAREPCKCQWCAHCRCAFQGRPGNELSQLAVWPASCVGTGWVTLVRRASAVSHPALCSVTASGQNRRPAAARSSASIASPCGLRFPLEILFAKCSKKISPEPP